MFQTDLVVLDLSRAPASEPYRDENALTLMALLEVVFDVFGFFVELFGSIVV